MAPRTLPARKPAARSPATRSPAARSPTTRSPEARSPATRSPAARSPHDRSPADEALAFFREQFRALGTPARAAGEKAYLKSELRFHGVTLPDIRRACVDFCREHPGLDRAGLRAAADALMASDFHDLRSAAVGLLERKRALLERADLPWLVGLVRRTGNWAHVDWIATKLIGPLLADRPEAPSLVRAWAADADLWVRRSALIAPLDALRGGGGDFPLFEAVAAPMLAEREFFIRKAIGWVLRDVSRRRPELTRGFLLRHGALASGLTWREASRRLPLAMRRDLPGPAPPKRRPRGAIAPPPLGVAPRAPRRSNAPASPFSKGKASARPSPKGKASARPSPKGKAPTALSRKTKAPPKH